MKDAVGGRYCFGVLLGTVGESVVNVVPREREWETDSATLSQT